MMNVTRLPLLHAVGLTVLLLCNTPFSVFANERVPAITSYGAWQVRCAQQNNIKICEMVQTLVSSDERQRVVATVALGQLPNTPLPRAVLEVPIGADLTQAPELHLGLGVKYSGRYVICASKFCRAEIELPDDVGTQIQNANEASIQFVVLGKNIVLTLTIDGMAAAFAALDAD